MDLEGAPNGMRLFPAWKASLELFDGLIEQSAIVGLSRHGEIGLRDISIEASTQGMPWGHRRGVFFPRREDALDWLSLDLKD